MSLCSQEIKINLKEKLKLMQRSDLAALKVAKTLMATMNRSIWPCRDRKERLVAVSTRFQEVGVLATETVLMVRLIKVQINNLIIN